MQPVPDNTDRLTTIETTVAHLQHDYDRLHQVALTLQADIRQIRQLLDKIMSQMEQLASGEETRSPEEERPPHY